MNDAIHGPCSAAPARGSCSNSSTPASNSIAFRALLDQLERSAQNLSRTSEGEVPREKLGDVVQEARASLEQMLSAKERLLEEWRAAQRGGAAT